MRAPFFLLVGVIGLYALSKDLPNLDAVLALYQAPQDHKVTGAEIFRKCAICHSLAPGVHRIGPSLHCVVGRRIAAEPGFRYSAAMRTARLDSAFGPYHPETWTRETLTAYVMDPQLTFGDTRMPFPGLLATVPDEDLLEVTTALIDHLEQSCDAEPRNLVALEAENGDRESLRCMTIAREKSIAACQSLADTLRAGDDGEGGSLPALACVVPGKLACDGAAAGE
jgi:cytochrome c2